MTTIAEVAGTAERVVEGFVKVEPFLATMGAFIPGAAPVVALVHPMVAMAAPFVEKALSDLATGNNGNALQSFFDLISHVSKGQANSPILSGPSHDPSA